MSRSPCVPIPLSRSPDASPAVEVCGVLVGNVYRDDAGPFHNVEERGGKSSGGGLTGAGGRGTMAAGADHKRTPANATMPTDAEYEKRIQKLDWPGLMRLWKQIAANSVDQWWPNGKAFEYLIVRMFELDKAEVTWPYIVNLLGSQSAEQIDGSVRFGGLHWLIESKDENENIAIDPIAKLRNQLLRRPWGTIGLVFTTTKFTPPAVLMTHFALPQPILLWTGAEVVHALKARHVCRFAQEKYRACVEHGVVDYNIAAQDTLQ